MRRPTDRARLRPASSYAGPHFQPSNDIRTCSWREFMTSVVSSPLSLSQIVTAPLAKHDVNLVLH